MANRKRQCTAEVYKLAHHLEALLNSIAGATGGGSGGIGDKSQSSRALKSSCIRLEAED